MRAKHPCRAVVVLACLLAVLVVTCDRTRAPIVAALVWQPFAPGVMTCRWCGHHYRGPGDCHNHGPDCPVGRLERLARDRGLPWASAGVEEPREP